MSQILRLVQCELGNFKNLSQPFSFCCYPQRPKCLKQLTLEVLLKVIQG